MWIEREMDGVLASSRVCLQVVRQHRRSRLQTDIELQVSSPSVMLIQALQDSPLVKLIKVSSARPEALKGKALKGQQAISGLLINFLQHPPV